VLGCVVQWTAR